MKQGADTLPGDHLMNSSRPVTYNATAQHWGEYLRGYDWAIYGTGTFRRPDLGVSGATAYLKRYFEQVDKATRSRIPYFAALERRRSGCGMPGINPHWHFLAAGDDPQSLARTAETVWFRNFGDAKVGIYDLTRPAAFYVAKLAGHPNGEFQFKNLELLEYRGPQDLLAAAHDNDYVPAHLKDRVFGEYLAVR
jgi:hypothetical protein